MKKRAQTEIVGLVIIVIIITIAMLFYLTYKAQPTNTTKKTLYQEFAHNELATSFSQSLLETHITSCQATVEELIVDCGSLRGKQIRCGAQSSCEKLEEVVIEIKNATLDEWNYAYGLTIKLSDYKNYTYIKDNCTTDTVGRGTPGIFLVPYFPDPGVGMVELGICKI